MKKLLRYALLCAVAMCSSAAMAQTTDFLYENDLKEAGSDLTVVGGGSFVDDATFGTVYQNVAGTAPRENYLLLPSDLLSHSADSKALTIGVWVNNGGAASETYLWAPLFAAYGAAPAGSNTWPMFVCQYRGLLQVNCAGYSDYVDAQNVAGVNTLYHGDTDWLADGDWHYYTAVLDGNNAKVYFDGELKNEWNVSGEGDGNVQQGLFTNGNELTYICLGGNQAWDWNDLDTPFKYAKLMVSNKALSQTDIKAIVAAKPAPTITEFLYENDLKEAGSNLTVVGSGSFVEDATFGTVYQNVAGTAPRENYLLLPSDLLSHSADSKALTIGVWVNNGGAASETYLWAPLFAAYGAAPAGSNTWPMFVCQYRGLLQVNCAGYSDYVDAQNVAGVNTLYHGDTDWLADGDWHYYTAVLDGNNAKVYFDGELKNEWNVSGEGDGNVQQGLFTNGKELSYICLGGNQAWDWNDLDSPFKYAKLMVSNMALSQTDIKAIVAAKPETTNIGVISAEKADNTVRYNLAGQRVGADFKGVVIENGRKVMVK